MDERANELTAEEIAELVRARQARSRWGGRFALVGLGGFSLIAAFLLWALIFKDHEIGVAELGILSMFGMIGGVGAGFADPGSFSKFWK